MFLQKLRKFAVAASVLCVCCSFCACAHSDGEGRATAKSYSSAQGENPSSTWVSSEYSKDTSSSGSINVSAASTTTTVVNSSASDKTTKTASRQPVPTASSGSKTTSSLPRNTSVVKKTSTSVSGAGRNTTTTVAPTGTYPTTTTFSVTTSAKVTTTVENDVNSHSIVNSLGKKQREVYKKIVDAMEHHTGHIDVSSYGMSQKQLEDILLVVSVSNFENNSISSKYTISVDDSGKVLKLELEFVKTKEQQAKGKKKLDEAVKKIVDGCNAKSDYEKIMYVHDEIIKNCRYDAGGANAYSAYGCLVDKRAVCEGYAKAFALVCGKLGIDALPVVGTSINAGGKPEAHMWNLVKLDGKWYHVDVTWDDSTTELGDDFVRYDYFMLSDRLIAADHTPSQISDFVYPAADDNSLEYFKYHGIEFSDAQTAFDAMEGLIVEKSDAEDRFVRVKLSSLKEYEKLKAMLFEKDENGVAGIFGILIRAGGKTSNVYFNPRRYIKVIDDSRLTVTVVLNFE